MGSVDRVNDPAGDRPDPSSVSLTPGDPLARLATWMASGRVHEAARSRARQRWLQRQADEESTFLGMLIDLAERRRSVLVSTTGTHHFRGTLRAVGADFVVVREQGLGEVVLPLRSVASVRPNPGDPGAAGDRPLTVELVLSDTLVELSADYPDVMVGAGGDELRGTLRAAGIDVLSVVVDGPRRDVVHLNSASLEFVAILSR